MCTKVGVYMAYIYLLDEFSSMIRKTEVQDLMSFSREQKTDIRAVVRMGS